jgi:hypothetical protein
MVIWEVTLSIPRGKSTGAQAQRQNSNKANAPLCRTVFWPFGQLQEDIF